jgi:hypothetical protein
VPDLDEAAAGIRELHARGAAIDARMRGLGRERLELARQCGERLAAVKERVGHGNWLPWVRDNCGFDARMASNYISVFEHWADLAPPPGQEQQPVSDLTIKAALKLISALRRPAALPAPAASDPAAGDVAHDDQEPAEFGDAGGGPEDEASDGREPVHLTGGSPDRLPAPDAGDPVGPAEPAIDPPAPAGSVGTAGAKLTASEPVKPGVEGPAGAAAVEERVGCLRASIRAYRLLPAACAGATWGVKDLATASEAARERAAELLKARTPRALADCPSCRGEGVVAGRPCRLCAGVGSELVG